MEKRRTRVAVPKFTDEPYKHWSKEKRYKVAEKAAKKDGTWKLSERKGVLCSDDEDVFNELLKEKENQKEGTIVNAL